MAQQIKRRWWSLWGGKKAPPEVEAPLPVAAAPSPSLAAEAQAQRITEQEAENILRDAHYKANLIEERARQAAQVFLMRCREDVQHLVVLEAKEAFYKLLAPVNEVLSTAQEVEHALKMRAVDLWDNASAQLEDYQSTPLGSLGPGQRENTVRHVAAADEDAAQAAEDTPPVDEVAAEELAAAATAAPSPPAAEREEPATDIAVPGEAEFEPEEPAPEKPAPEEPAAEEPKQPEETLAAQVAAEGPPVEQAEAKREEGEEAPGARGHRAGEGEETETPAAPVQRGPGSYVGELELLIEPYTNVAKISKLYRDLGAIQGVRVLRTSGAWDRGTVITVALSEPITLAFLAGQLPDVDASPATPGGESWWKSAVGLKRQGSSAQGAVTIAFKSPEKAHGDDAQDEGHDSEDAPNEMDHAEEERA